MGIETVTGSRIRELESAIADQLENIFLRSHAAEKGAQVLDLMTLVRQRNNLKKIQAAGSATELAATA